MTNASVNKVVLILLVSVLAGVFGMGVFATVAHAQSLGYVDTYGDNFGYVDTYGSGYDLGYIDTYGDNFGYVDTYGNYDLGYVDTWGDNLGYVDTYGDNYGYVDTYGDYLGYVDTYNLGYVDTYGSNLGYVDTWGDNLGYVDTYGDNLGYVDTYGYYDLGYVDTYGTNLGYLDTYGDNLGYVDTSGYDYSYDSFDIYEYYDEEYYTIRDGVAYSYNLGGYPISHGKSSSYPSKPITVTAPKYAKSNTSTTNNTCTGGSCNTTYTDNSINGSFNDNSINNSFNTAPVYTAQSQPLVQYVFPQQQYQPVYRPSPYVALSQIPYTGFDGGVFGGTLYWIGLIAFALASSYLVLYYKGGASMFTSAIFGLSGQGTRTAKASNASRSAHSGNSGSIATPAMFTRESQKAHAPIARRERAVLEKLPVARSTASAETNHRDSMSFAHGEAGEAPRIVVSRN